MSGWNAYTDALVATKNVTSAAIIGLDGNTWASSGGLSVTPAEAKVLISAFADASPLRAGGLNAGGVKYIALQCDDKVLMGKKGAGGVIVSKSGKTIVVGAYSAESGVQAGPASSSVQSMAADLTKKGF